MNRLVKKGVFIHNKRVFVNSLSSPYQIWQNPYSLLNFGPVKIFDRITGHRRFQDLLQWMYRPIDGSSVAAFRAGFGAIMMWEVWRYFDHNWIERYYTGKIFYFTYPGFSWVHPLPNVAWMEALFLFIAALGFLIAIGFLYRYATVLMFFCFSYVYLLEQARYLNHFYFVALVALAMIFIPANRTWSVDAWFSKKKEAMPQWGLWMLRLQFGITYFYGGIAKLNHDWLRGYPLSDWISDETHLFLIGPYVGERWMGLFMSYAGLILDLLFVPLLLYRPTRWIGFGLALAFNLMNAHMFSIGIFPWFMIVGTLLFFEADWPKRLWDFCTLENGKWKTESAKRKEKSSVLLRITTEQKAIALLMAIFTAFQLLFPFRHFFYPGSVHWTEEGHMYSWHMKLRSKNGSIHFVIKDPDSGKVFEIDPDEYLNDRQVRKMKTRPQMILQFAHWLRDRYQSQGMENVEVYTESFASLNDHERQRFIDPEVDLAKIRWSPLPNSMHQGLPPEKDGWIVPLGTF